MNVIDAVHARRAVKHFDPEHELTEDEVRLLLETALQAPTSFNLQHWRLVVVRDPELRRQIRAAANGQAQVTDASLLIVLTGDVDAWKKDPGRYWANAPEPVRDLMVKMIGPFHEGREALQRDEAQRSIGMILQTIMLTATDMGYDSCPMIGFDHEQVAELIGMPDDHVMGPLVVVGKKTKDAWPKPGQLPPSEVVFEDRFPG